MTHLTFGCSTCRLAFYFALAR